MQSRYNEYWMIRWGFLVVKTMENMTDQDVTEMVSEAITVLSNETTEHEDVGESANYFLDWSKVLHQREDLVKELVKGSTCG